MVRYAVVLPLSALPIVLSITTRITSNTENEITPYESLRIDMTQARTFTDRDAIIQATTATEPAEFSFEKRLGNSTGSGSELPTTFPGLFSTADNRDVYSENAARDENRSHTTNAFCDDNWSPFEDFCFYLIFNESPGKSFSDYESDCRRLGGHLSTIHSDEERKYVLDYINDNLPVKFFTNNKSSDSIWIGFYSLDFGGWHSTDGSSPDFDEDKLSQTTYSSIRGTGACISISPPFGEYLIDSCNTQKHGAMCKSRSVRIFNNNNGEAIYSPNYPGNYDNTVTEKYLIQAPEGFIVSLTFESFQLEGDFPECSFDSLVVYDGSTTSSSVLGKFCGENLPPSFNSSSNGMFLKFVSDELINKQGFWAKGTFLPRAKPAELPTAELPTAKSRPDSEVLSLVLIGVICAVAVTFIVLLLLHRWKTLINKDFFHVSGRNITNNHEGSFRKNDLEVIVEGRNEISLKDVKEFPRSRLSIKSCIGRGAFSFVYKAKAVGILPPYDITPVAVKILKDTVTAKEKQDFLNELLLLNNLKHPNVVSCYGFCRFDECSVCLIMEYLENGSLLDYLRSFSEKQPRLSVMRTEKDSPMITSKQLMRFGLEIANGMEYLASKNLVHRDLAARNILLGDNLQCKVSDLGLARDLKYSNEYEMRSKSRVPVRWMSPESIFRNKYSTASDVWSYGVVLWEIATLGSHPYPGLGCTQIRDDVKKGIRLPQPTHCRSEIYNIMKTCWQYNPSERPGFSDLKQTLDKMLEEEMDYFVMENFKEDEYVYSDEEDSRHNNTFEETDDAMIIDSTL